MNRAPPGIRWGSVFRTWCGELVVAGGWGAVSFERQAASTRPELAALKVNV
jgi:hypothetical protein